MIFVTQPIELDSEMLLSPFYSGPQYNTLRFLFTEELFRLYLVQ